MCRDKKYYILIILFSLCLCQGCGGEFFSMAKEGIPILYAAAENDAGTAMLVISATSTGFYSERETAVPAGISGVMHVTAYGEIFITDANTVYRGSLSSSGSWETNNLTNPPTQILSIDDRVFAYISAESRMYRLDRDSGSWNEDVTFALPPLSAQTFKDRIYLLYSSAGTQHIDDYLSGAVLVPSYSNGPGNCQFIVAGGDFYVGKLVTDAFSMRINGNATVDGSLSLVGLTPMSYAVSGGTVFAAGLDTSDLAVYRMSGGTFIPEYGFGETTGTITMIGLGPDHLAVAITGTTVSDGLYLYNHGKKKMHKLTSRIIMMMTRS